MVLLYNKKIGGKLVKINSIRTKIIFKKKEVNTNREENKKCYFVIKYMKQSHKIILKLLWQVG